MFYLLGTDTINIDETEISHPMRDIIVFNFLISFYFNIVFKFPIISA